VIRFAVLLLMVALCSSCAMSNLQRINLANDSVHGLTKTVMPAVDAKCRAAAEKCKADGIAKWADCKPTVECSKWRDGYYKLANGIHMSAASAAVLTAIGKGDGLKQLAVKVTASLAKAYEMAVAAGYL